MINIKRKIDDRLNKLEYLLNNNLHLDQTIETCELIASISKFWSVLDENEQDYLLAAKYACDNKKPWQ